ncbi:MAG: hypothetical protein EBS82_03750, partial [Methylocystaceae bacterium]|nr:hypothetical protein [Methylocystaceae bacterium]
PTRIGLAGELMKQLILFSLLIALMGFGVWSFFVASRYQALCELSYFSASTAELKHCDERLSELK